jgi:two-component system chemotaxis response regulator CheY
MLEGFEFAVSEAENGKVALDACAQKMPDAVLLDWNMPVMSGIEFLRALRKAPGGDAPIVILCTTENDVNHIREAIEAGANEYIMKPFDQSILESKLAQVGLLDAPST